MSSRAPWFVEDAVLAPERAVQPEKDFPMSLLRSQWALISKLTRSGMLWMSGGLGVYMLSQWGVAIIIAKISGPEALGEFGLAQAICSPIFFLTNLGLRAGKATDVKKLYDFRTYQAVRLLSSTVGMLLTLAAALAMQRSAFSTSVFLLVAFTKAVETQSDLLYGLLQSRRKLRVIGRSYILRGPLGVLAFWLGFSLTDDLRIGLAGLAGVWLALYVVHDFVSSHRVEAMAAKAEGPSARATGFGPRFTWSEMSPLIWASMPLGAAAAVASIQQMMPRYFLEIQLSTREVGYFTALAYLLNAMVMFLNSFGFAFLTEMADAFANRHFRRFIRISIANAVIGASIGAIAFVVCWIGDDFILTHLYAREFAAFAGVFVVMMASGVCRCAATLLQFSLMGARAFKATMTRQYALTALTAVFTWFGIYWDGLMGAAWAMVATSIAQLFLVGGAIWFAVKTARDGGPLSDDGEAPPPSEIAD